METPALPQAALEYVIDGDREYRQLEAQLHDANERNDGHAIVTIHGKLDALTHRIGCPCRQPAARPRLSQQ